MQADDTFPLPRELVGDGTLFLLKAAGDSMAGAGIADGDWCVVREQQDTVPGDLVAVMTEGDAVVVTHEQAGAAVAAGDATVIGKVTAVLRRL